LWLYNTVTEVYRKLEVIQLFLGGQALEKHRCAELAPVGDLLFSNNVSRLRLHEENVTGRNDDIQS
jgi:hypothetical protein